MRFLAGRADIDLQSGPLSRTYAYQIGRAERFLEVSCWQLLRGASWIPVESQQVCKRPFGRRRCKQRPSNSNAPGRAGAHP